MLTDSDFCKGFWPADGGNLVVCMLSDAFLLSVDTLDECIGRRNMFSRSCPCVGIFSLALEIRWLPRGKMLGWMVAFSVHRFVSAEGEPISFRRFWKHCTDEIDELSVAFLMTECLRGSIGPRYFGCRLISKCL